MNKKLTPLKAFKKLREQNDFLKQRNIPKECRYDDELDIIETALKDYEQLKIDFLKEATENDYLKTALENIKNHIVEIKEGNIIGKPVNNNELIIRFRKFDNTEECDLLKEVLKDE